ncbi:MAG: PAS domain S-box protein [Chloroflexaceae bacterium]|nr:PAS domain S-box protein [Chloroflexaceae bacterium]
MQSQDEVGMLASAFNQMTTRLKTLYEDLRRSEEHFRSLIENSSDIITIVNRDSLVLYESPTIERVLGYPAGRVRDHLLTEFVHPEDIPRFLQALDQSFAEPLRMLSVEFRFRHANGAWRVLEARGQYRQHMSGEPGIVINARDITLRKQAEEDRVRLREENMKARSEFISTVSHELRTPLTPIRGYVDVLLMGAGGRLTDQQREFLQTIRDNTLRMRSLIDDLLDVGRLEAGKITLTYNTLYLGDLIQHEIRLLQAEIDRKEMQINLDIVHDLPAVQADSKRVSQIFVNLFSNALKYTYNGGIIRVRAYCDDAETVAIEITDTGVGMSPEQLEKLFTPFYRADNPLRTEAGGTGLGLTIARSFAHLHGGDIVATSEQGVGSTFTFTLPIKPAPRQQVQVVDYHGNGHHPDSEDLLSASTGLDADGTPVFDTADDPDATTPAKPIE